VEIIFPFLDAVAPRSIVETGAARGEFTRELLVWADGSGTTITAVVARPRAGAAGAERGRSRARADQKAEPRGVEPVPVADAVVIDGDHTSTTRSARSCA
jgi:hypothetical protein